MIGAIRASFLGVTLFLLLSVSTTASTARAAAAPPPSTDGELVRTAAGIDADPPLAKAPNLGAAAAPTHDQLVQAIKLKPNDAKLKLQLAALDYEALAFDEARRLIREILAQDADAETQRIAEGLSNAIDQVSVRQSWWASATVSERYETDPAGSGPVVLSGHVYTHGNPATQGSIVLWHAYVLGKSGGRDTLETTLSAYDDRQVNRANLDFWQIELASGPRVQLARFGFPEASLRPYVIGSYADLSHRPFLHSAGEGVSLSTALGAWTGLDVSVERRRFRFFDSNLYTRFDERNSVQDRAQAALRRAITQRLSLGLAVTRVTEDARTTFWSHRDLEGSGGLTYVFRPEFAGVKRDWSLNAGLSRRRAAYAGPDPSVDPFDTRVDREWLASLAASVPSGQRFMTTFKAQWRDLNSTVKLYAYRDLSLMVGVTWTASGRSASFL